MRIDRLELKNFRCFEDKEFNFSSRFTLLIGENGSGKTTVLDALAAGMGSLLGGFDGMNIRPIKEYEIRHVKRRMGQSTTFEPQPSVYVRCTGEVADSGRISWELSGRQDGAVTYSTINSIIKQAKRMQTRVRAFDESMILPVLGYYGAGRLWRQKSGSLEVLTPASRIKGYVDCLNPSSDEKTLMRWVKTMQIAEIQHNTKIPVLQTVLAAVENCLEDCEAAYYDIELDEFIITLKDKNSLPVYMLSDGQRAILIMAADIAYRAAFLNPQLEMNAPRETPGIVLIDEIDLHLHPAWQR
ncbi:MAG: AAA family ATPase, partial [Gammaproteobacteria bacterium]|nr:AAA family ATPase [Gammaproteobacteria bacterium]